VIVPHGAAPPPAAKRVLRDEARRRRAARTPEQRAVHGQQLAAVQHPLVDQARTVTAYVGVADEPDTLPLVAALHARGVRVLLPVVLPDLDLEWAEYTGPEDLARTRHGLLEPTGPRLGRSAVADADVLLVPAFAVDADGRRIGQGGGCYDRALARVPDTTPVLAVVFPDELVPGPLPEEPHDRRVDGVLIPAE
jgi:5-formyltetrahydrofolate cyclo-ligase